MVNSPLSRKSKKMVFAVFSLLSLLGYGFFVFAAPPGPGGYNPGEILDPECTPGQLVPEPCIVKSPLMTADNGLTVTGSNVQLGGVITEPFTVVDVASNTFGIVANLAGGLDAAGLVVSDYPIPGSHQAGFFGGSTAADTEVLIAAISYGSDSIARMVHTNNGNNRVNTVDVTDLQAAIKSTTTAGGTSAATVFTEYNRAAMVFTPTGGGVNEYSGIFATTDGVFVYGKNDGVTSNMRWINNISGTQSTIAQILNNGDWEWSAYQQSRDDSGVTTPINFLYTDSSGNVLSAPISAISGGSGWALTGDAGTTAGTNFIGTTDTEDFIIKTNGNQIALFGQNGNVAIGSAFGPFATPVASGIGSFASGLNTVASGVASNALGINAAASGNGAFAAGTGNTITASGDASVAIGENLTASGYGSVALGWSATASGRYSFAGSRSTASGESSVAFGTSTYAPSFNETSLGLYTANYTPLNDNTYNLADRLFSIGNGTEDLVRNNAYTLWKDGSFAFNDDNFQNDNIGTEQNMFYFNYGNHDGLGIAQTKRAIRLGSVCNTEADINGTDVGDRSVAIGFALVDCLAAAPVASGPNSIAIGRSTIASGQDDIAFGVNAQASGGQSIAIGQSSFAQGMYSIVLGSSIISSGEGSIGIGGYHLSEGIYSTAIGRGNTASGDYSTALGSDTIASGQYSSAAGYTTEASGDYSTAFGIGAVASGTSSTAFGSGSFAFGRVSTAFGKGKAYSFFETAFGMHGTEYTPVSETVWASTDRLVNIGNGDGAPILGPQDFSDAFTILKSGLTGIGYDNFETTTLTALLQVNGEIQQLGATSCALSADSDGMIICTPSDENLKTNINNLTYGLDTLTTLRPVSYTFKDAKYGTGSQIGFIAQELEQVIPEVVTNGPNYKSVNYGLLSSVIVNAIQEMNLNVTDLNNNERPNTWRDSLIAWLGNVGNGITKLFAGEIHTDTLCVGQTCLNETQVQQILQTIGSQGSTPSQSNTPAPNLSDDSGNGDPGTGDNGDTGNGDNVSQSTGDTGASTGDSDTGSGSGNTTEPAPSE